MKRVMIVDDDETNRDIIMKSLRRDSLELYEAGSGPEALTLAAAVHPDLVILDIMMPGMTGYEVCERLRQSPEHNGTRILFLSARDSEVARLSAENAGGDEYLAKPFSPKHLSETVSRILGAPQVQSRPR